jgi:large subunit ribosomal protein L1
MKNYPLDEALNILKGTASAKFDESVDVAINLGIDAKKSDQNVRGTAVMPRGTGKKVRIAVFAEGNAAEAAKKAGADIVGFQDLADQIKAGKIEFDLAIATPEAMKIVGQLGQILGPRGLMPNPKVGTVTPNVAKAVENAKAGQAQFRTDKAGIVHCAIGKASFEAEALKENLMSLVAALNKVKPAASKGAFLKKVTISTTMGPGIRLDTSGL